MTRRRGFTLVELLVTVTLVSFVGATVVAAVSGCLRVWERINAQGRQEEWVRVAFDQLRRDLRSARTFRPVPFEGAYDAVSFPTVVTADLRDGSTVDTIGRTGYYFNSFQGTLCRSQQPYQLVRRVGVKDRCQTVLTGVKRVRFSFYRPDTETQGGGWSGAWDSAAPPLAVKVEVGYHEQARGPLKSQTLLVYLPLGGAVR
jgi:prepilin-type N-terminal cleavage/methylation domain-containing protein